MEMEDVLSHINSSDRFTVAGALKIIDAIPEGAMRVGPGTDAVVWKICPDYKSEL